MLATHITFKRTAKATITIERRKLSHNSAREITSQLAIAAGIGRRHHEANSFDRTTEGQKELDDRVAAMTHHAGYIDDEIIQASVDEATDFLRPPPKFEAHLGKSAPSIIADLQSWLGPMVQAHILGKAMSEEPAFPSEYRETHHDLLDEWEALMEYADEKRA